CSKCAMLSAHDQRQLALIGCTISTMNRESGKHDVGRRCIGWVMLLFGTVVAAFGARNVVGFEPLPTLISPENILACLDFRRYLGIWPWVLGIGAGVGFLVVGLLLLVGFG